MAIVQEQQFSNNATSTTTALLNTSDTSVTLSTGTGDFFPELDPGEFFMATLVVTDPDDPNYGASEIVQVTARVDDVLTIVRGQEGTAALTFPLGSLFELRPTASAFNRIYTALGDISTDLETNYAPLSGLEWLAKPIGEPFPLWDHIPGCPVPPTNDPRFRFIKLTASDSYNDGVLTDESVSGSAPLVTATAEIDLAGSPLNGATVHLINTEARFLRAGVSGTVQDDAFQNITGTLDIGNGANGARFLNGTGTGAFTVTKQTETWMPAGTTQSSSDFTSVILFDAGDSPGARTANETRGKNIQATYYMRIQ